VCHGASLRSGKDYKSSALVINVSGHLSFDDLLMRISPAASRIQKLSQETPCISIVFTFSCFTLRERRERLGAL
jgi:hypothetical protein